MSSKNSPAAPLMRRHGDGWIRRRARGVADRRPRPRPNLIRSAGAAERRGAPSHRPRRALADAGP
ncbi:hypothetical protein HMPREF0682_0252, partial [Propionibacterium acidifaciens F0233]